MVQGRARRIKSLFGQVADMPRDKRIEYLEQVCGGDDDLIDEALVLCEGDEESESQDYWENGIWILKSSTNRRNKMVGEDIKGYKIVKELTGGGMGEVYLAQRVDGLLDRKAVIKIAGAHLPKEEYARFKGEMKTQESLDHPNIGRIFDAGLLNDGRPFMIMEYVEGQSLRDLLLAAPAESGHSRRQIALPLDDVVEIAQEVCAGLAEAHSKKIVHRDIKPENIIIRREGGAYKVKIIDFGLALPQESGMLPTRRPTAGIVGTPEYMSPEQVMPASYYLKEPGEKTSARADIYALGVVIYELLTGSRPFSGSGQEVALKHVTEHPIAPGKLRPDLNIPGAVDRVVLKALAKAPGERQPTIERFARDLKVAAGSRRLDQSSAVTLAATLESEVGSKAPNPYRRKFLWAAPAALAVMFAPLVYFRPWESNAAGDDIRPTPTVAASPSPVTPLLAMNVSVVRQGERGREEPVSPSAIFHNGERVKVFIQAAQNGFAYILQRGASGKVSLLYPDPRIGDGGNRIVKGGSITIPSGKSWFKFNNVSGAETVYVLFAENKTEELMGGVEAAASKDGAALASQLDKQAVDLSATGGSLLGQGMLVGVLKLRHQP